MTEARLIAIVALAIASASPAVGQTRPYAQWTQAEQMGLAAQLKAKSDRDCAPYTAEARTGSMRASYEAAACLYGTYYLGVPRDYPNRAQLRQQALENANQAVRLGSNAPVLTLAR